MSLYVVGHTFNITLYKYLVIVASKYALMHIAKEFDRVKLIGFDKERCQCVLRRTHGLQCACDVD